MLNSLRLILKAAFQDFGRNIWLSAATLIVLFLALVSVNFLIVFNVLSETAVKFVEQKIDLSLYFKPEVEEAKINEIKTYLGGLTEVQDITYISPADAIAAFRERHKNEAQIIESLNEITLGENGKNPFGGTLVIKAKRTEDFPAILEVINNPKIIDPELIGERDYNDYEQIINRIAAIKSKVETGGLGVTIIFAIIAILIVVNTIRLAIYTHREEIGVMKLVGATNWFVRAPYLMESILLALIVNLLLIALIFPALSFINPYLAGFFDGSNFNIVEYFQSNALWIFGGQILGSIVLCLVSSGVAVGRYLKV